MSIFRLNHPAISGVTKIQGHSMDDKHLLDQYLAGDDAALTMLVKHYQKDVYGFICRQVRNPVDAEDLTQKVFVNVFLKAEQFSGDASFKTWLYQIAINLCKNHYRANDRQRIDSTDVEDLGLVSAQICEDDFVVEEERSQLKKSINRLPEKQRLTVKLRLYQECTFKEIAEIMSSSVGTAKAHYHQAVKSLHRMFNEAEYETSEL
jgi:RNA polymerase sigma-70 factor (ECF subfamily)